MIKITFLDETLVREFFFESPLETYNWLKNIDTDEKDIFVDHRFTKLESLNANFLKRAKEIVVLKKLIGA